MIFKIAIGIAVVVAAFSVAVESVSTNVNNHWKDLRDTLEVLEIYSSGSLGHDLDGPPKGALNLNKVLKAQALLSSLEPAMVEQLKTEAKRVYIYHTIMAKVYPKHSKQLVEPIEDEAAQNFLSNLAHEYKQMRNGLLSKNDDPDNVLVLRNTGAGRLLLTVALMELEPAFNEPITKKLVDDADEDHKKHESIIVESQDSDFTALKKVDNLARYFGSGRQLILKNLLADREKCTQYDAIYEYFSAESEKLGYKHEYDDE